MNLFEINNFDFQSYNIAYIDEGRGNPILFLHNGGSSHRMFDRQLEHFSKSRRVIAMDWIGLGASDKPRGIVYDAELYMNQITAMMNHLGIRQFDLVGCCVGGGIAVMYARRHPSRVKTLTTVTINTPALTRLGMLGWFLAKPGSLKYKVLNVFSRTAVSRLTVFPRILNVQLGEIGLADESYAECCRYLYENPDVAHTFTAFNYFSMSELDTDSASHDFPPHLAVWGEDNPVLLSEQGCELVKRWGAKQRLFIEDCTYNILREAPKRVNAAIETHLLGQRCHK